MTAEYLDYRDVWPKDIRVYHQRTRHAPHRYAMGPAFLDWESQPDPFRRFAGARTVPLDIPQPNDIPVFGDWNGNAPSPLNRDNVGRLLELSLGISAWKAIEGALWAVRNNPSSGNLHPTEAYVVLPPLAGVGERAALYHYAPREHALEERCVYDQPPELPLGGFLVGLSSVAWREAWKYGERAFRYVQLDAGHAIGALAYAAAVLGWRVRVLAGPGDAQLAAWLGLNRDDAWHAHEVERPEMLLAVFPEGEAGGLYVPGAPPTGSWYGRANRLSDDHEPWPVVDLAAALSEKPATAPPAFPEALERPLPPLPGAVRAERVIRSRRSVQQMDGVTAISSSVFCRILAATLPAAGVPWTAFPWPCRLTLLLYIHRVEGVEPGVYALARDPETLARLRAAADPGLAWQPVVNEAGLPLYLLAGGNCQKLAAQLSCLQAIAGKSAFALSMIADFARTLTEEGDWAWRRLHWEAGLLGQVLYLEATAAGLTGTGIGCFFDDSIREVLGLHDDGMAWQPVYNFTVGGGLEDMRILTLPAYPGPG